MAQKSKESWSLFWLARYKPYPMVILSALMLVLSFPPFPFSFLAYVAFVPLLLVIDHTPEKVFEDRFWGFFKAIVVLLWRFVTLQFIWRFKQKPWIYKRQIISRYAQIFRYAYTTFVIWNFGCCYWLMLTATAADNPLQALSAGLVANLVNPFLMAIPIYLFARVRSLSHRLLLSLTLVPFWVTFEWLHFHWELSWSWLTLGHSQAFYPIFYQYAEWTGVLGISAHILVVNVLVYQVVRANEVSKRSAALLWGAAAGVALLPFALNIGLLSENRAVFQSSGTLKVRIVQPNIDPYDKFHGMTHQEQVEVFVGLINKPGIDTIDMAVLPETAIPKPIWRRDLLHVNLLEPLRATVDQEKISLLTGFTEAYRFPPNTQNIPITARAVNDRSGLPRYFYEIYNASLLLNPDAEPQTSQKAKLVPMVERMPYLEYFSFLKEFSIDLGGALGNFGKPLESNLMFLPDSQVVAPLVCYESEYGDYTRRLVQEGGQLIVIVTNDGWWNLSSDPETGQRSGSSGHIQHASLASIRAVETRRAIARSANTGTSMFVDNRGNVDGATEYWIPTFVDRKINLYDAQTFYTQYGDWIGWLAGFLTLLAIGWVLKAARQAGAAGTPAQ
ncbi:MAG: apolipoprotein N-acyltransferase [Bacteroidota bacterium]